MSAENKAVFLSYAREDTAAAQRIAEALRSHGVEVWFDQNELRGGDAWDQKIRRQISDCTLFLPVISQNTQERHKGYFRLEWKLAVEQTHQMAEGVAFVAPVVVDNTSESSAVVPPEFMRVQWTRLPGALPTPQFVEQIKRLLEAPHKATSATRPGFPVVSSFPPIAAGSHSSRKIPLAIAAVAALVLAGAAYFALRPAAQITDKSIAILPFTNMSDDKENTAFFSDGMHEDILTNLGNIRELRVVSRTSVEQYRDTKKPIPQIARELGVAYILEGSVRRSGNAVRITGQLIRANDEHLWAKAYDRDLTATNLFGIQADIATQIAGALRAALSPEEKSLVQRRPTENLAAYDSYLKGRDIRNRAVVFTRVSLNEREKQFQDAVDLDPNFAEAWGELAFVHALYVFNDYDHTPARLSQADAALERAMLLSPGVPDIVLAGGEVAFYGHSDYLKAIGQFEEVIRLQPNDARAVYSLGDLLRSKGRWGESLGEYRKAAKLDPGNLLPSRQLRILLAAGRRWDEALDAQRQIIALQPDRNQARLTFIQLAYQATGSTKEADDWLGRLSPTQFESPRVVNARKYWANVKGDYAEWKRLDQLRPFFEEDGTPHWTQALEAATVLAAQGDMAAARDRLAAFPAEIRSELAHQPDNLVLWSALGRMEALLGQKEEALRDSQRAVQLAPEKLEAVSGPQAHRNLAIVYAWTGDKERALAELTRLLGIPFGTISVHDMRTDAAFAPLHGDPRFEALLNDPKNNAPLF